MSNKKIISLIVVLLSAFGAIGYGIYGAEKNSAQNASSQTTQSPAPQNTPPAQTPTASVTTTTTVVANTTKRSKYNDGTYSATGTYDSPGGLESVSVSLTIANDIVTGATVTSGASDGTSRRYQQMFISGYKTYVIGKDIDTLNLDRVSGSSLTPIGFDNALAKIKTEAQA